MRSVPKSPTIDCRNVPASAETILSSITDGFVAFDAEWRFTYVNKQAERLMGKSAKDVLGRVIWDVFSDATGSPFKVVYDQAQTTRRVQTVEAFSPRLNRWLAVHTYPTARDGLAVYFRDITVQKQTELQLRDSEERFRATFEQAPVGIAVVDRQGRWLRVNRRLCAILGYRRDELLAHTFQDVAFPADIQLDAGPIEQLMRGAIGTYEMEKRYSRKANGHVWCRVTVSLVRNPDRTPKYFIAIVEDISARKVSEALLASAAHELRAPLSHIKGFMSTLRNLELDTDTRREFMAEIESEADRLEMLIEDLLEHTGGSVARRRTPITPGDLLANSVRRARQELGERVVQVAIPSHLPTLEVDVPSVERVFINLLHNAHKYSPKQAPIDITAELDRSMRMLEFHIDDHGPGVPADQRELIFTPFYRSTSAAESPAPGKGLGLAICRSIVSAHGGEVMADDAPGGGARFTVAIPLKVRSGRTCLHSSRAVRRDLRLLQ